MNNESTQTTEPAFPDIISRLDRFEEEIIQSEIAEFWKALPDGTFLCKVSGRRLSAKEFSIFRDRSYRGSLNFIIEVCK